MTDFTQDLFSRRRNASDGNTRVVSAGKLWYDSITNTLRVSDGHSPGGQIVAGGGGASAYTLPTATPSVKGGVQLGANIVASGATIDVLSPTRVSQLENDSNYLSGAVLATYATQSYVTSQGYVTSTALATGNANVIAANSRITSLDANIGAYQIWANANVTTLSSNAGTQATSINRLDANIGAYHIWANGRITSLDGNLGTATTNISNLVTQANANTTALLTGSVTTGPLTVDTTSGGYFANISAWGRPQSGRQSWRFYVNNGIGGPASFFSFPDNTNQFTAYPGTATTLDDFDANIGTLFLGNVSTQANLGAFQTWANSKIGTSADGNLVVTATTSSTGATTGALVVRGGAGFAGNIWSANAYIGSNTDNYIKIAGGVSPATPTITALGSDASVGINVYTKGISGVFGVYTNSVKQFDVYGPVNTVSWVRASGAPSGNAPYIQAAGSATDIDIAVSAKNDGNVVITGGNVVTSLTGNINLGANLRVYSTVGSTSTTTGALVVQGGAGVAGALNVGTALTVDNGAYGNVTTTQYGSLFAYAYGPNNYSILQAWSQGTQGLGLNSYGTQLYSSGAIVLRTGATLKDKDYPTGGVLTVQVAANGAIINGTGITSTSTGTGALIVTGGAGVSGNLNLGNYANLYMSSGTLNSQAALNLVGNVTGKSGAGAGYHDFMMVQSTNSAITNGQKWFRINQAGGLEIVNSGFTTTLFRLEDNGDLTIAGNVTQNGIKTFYSSARPGFRVYGSGTTNNLNTSVNTTGALNSNNWTVDFNQGSYLNSSTGVFTAPVAGLYQTNMVVRNSGNVTSIMQASIVKNATGGNGVGGAIQVMVEFAANSSMNHAGGGTVLSLAVGDTLALKVTAGTINFDSNDNWSVAYIG